ncbi:MAG: sigma-70 family RNA polymerase sigma factor [Rhodobacterales bacterium]|nr:sigma-70 family RNA polymerase sigma factor [Rhodobacterales bacterium]
MAPGVLASGNVAEEVVQETWMAVLKGLPEFQDRSALKTWFFRISANRARTRGRKEGRSIPMSALGNLDQNGKPVVDVDRLTTLGIWARPSTEFGVTPESMADRSEIRKQVDSAIATLPDRQRLVITLRDLDGCSSDEVGNVLEISATNQRVLLHRARSKVRQA